MLTAREVNNMIQVKYGSYERNCLEVDTRPLINAAATPMQQTLVDNAE